MLHVGGRFVAPEEAVVSALDRGFLLGDGVFATLRGYGGVCFRARRHLAELARGAALFGIELPLASSLEELVDEAARRTGAADAYVRVTVTRGVTEPTLTIVARAMDIPREEAYRDGVDVVTVGPRRIPPACLDGSIKTTSYAVQVLARREVEARGAYEGIQLAIDGTLAGGTMSNLFVIRGDALLTPSLASGCRGGVTRGAVLELAPRFFGEVREEPLAAATLDDADEVFLTSTRIELLPVARIDGRNAGRSRERTSALRAAFRELVAHEAAS